MANFQITTVPAEGTRTLVLSGEADVAAANEIVRRGVLSFDDPFIGELVLDLQGIVRTGAEGLANAVPVPRPPLKRLHDQQVECPLQYLDAGRRFRTHCVESLLYFSVPIQSGNA